MIPALLNGQTVSGYVADNSWNYYHYNAFSSNSLMVQMNQVSQTYTYTHTLSLPCPLSLASVNDVSTLSRYLTGFSQTSGGDCDLYVRADTNPDRFNYNYRDISFHANVSLIIPDPSDRTWYIGVYGYRACSYLLTVLDTCTLLLHFVVPAAPVRTGSCTLGALHCVTVLQRSARISVPDTAPASTAAVSATPDGPATTAATPSLRSPPVSSSPARSLLTNGMRAILLFLPPLHVCTCTCTFTFTCYAIWLPAYIFAQGVLLAHRHELLYHGQPPRE
jgi:hypothetical protein